MAGCKWYEKLPERYVYTHVQLMERTIPAADVEAVTAVSGVSCRSTTPTAS